ncbi:hypothetical protein DFJ73DRAFT_782785 [Zopfochytrium polystomum]|nr:hypothetical protein DFJ73DRAFT_782785 [Zopfochytrium polystomum]
MAAGIDAFGRAVARAGDAKVVVVGADLDDGVAARALQSRFQGSIASERRVSRCGAAGQKSDFKLLPDRDEPKRLVTGALHDAALAGSLDMVTFCLERGADRLSPSAKKALGHAISTSRVPMVETLLDASVPPSFHLPPNHSWTLTTYLNPETFPSICNFCAATIPASPSSAASIPAANKALIAEAIRSDQVVRDFPHSPATLADNEVVVKAWGSSWVFPDLAKKFWKAFVALVEEGKYRTQKLTDASLKRYPEKLCVVLTYH